jgi:Domain of unknown function (DUF4112)
MTANNDSGAPKKDPALAQLDLLADLLDNKFRIPFTSFRFGLDAVIGLVPYAGDFAGLLISLWIMGITVKKGAGPILLLRMAGNVVLDSIAGTIPFVGDLFDLGFKSNRRNINMLKAYYSEDKKRPNVMWSFAFFFFLILLILIGVLWFTFKAIAYFWGLIF